MEITGSALTALFVGLIWTLIKVVEHFISKRGGKIQGLTDDQIKKFDEISIRSEKLDNVESSLNVILDKIKYLYDMHSVYDENRVPKWYVSSEMLPMIRKIDTSLSIIGKEVESDFSAVKAGQSAVTQRVLYLLTAQKLMIERLGDIITRLNKSE